MQLHCGCVIRIKDKVSFKNTYDFYHSSKLNLELIEYSDAVCRKHEEKLYIVEQYALYGQVALKLR